MHSASASPQRGAGGGAQPQRSPRIVPIQMKGDPEHVNTKNNRPYTSGGVVPWTGAPPVLRGPQPTCVIPIRTPEGEELPRHLRVQPGKSLYDTPQIPITVVSRDIKCKQGTIAKIRNFLLRRPTPVEICREANLYEPWYKNLIHFNAVEESPPPTDDDDDNVDRLPTRKASLRGTLSSTSGITASDDVPGVSLPAIETTDDDIVVLTLSFGKANPVGKPSPPRTPRNWTSPLKCASPTCSSPEASQWASIGPTNVVPTTMKNVMSW